MISHRHLFFPLFFGSFLISLVRSDPMNFIFYFPDETRAESLGTYGHPLTATPNFDELARNGTRFDQAHVAYPICVPSRCALVTGWYTHVLGHRTQRHLIQDYEPNLFKYLAQAGYTISWYGKNDVLSQESLFQSITNWYPWGGLKVGPITYPFGEAGYYSFLYNVSNVTGNSTENGDYNAIKHAGEYLRGQPREPFMLFIPGEGAHPPYGAPLDYYYLYDPAIIQKNSPLRPADLPNKPRYMSRQNGIQYFRNFSNITSDDMFYQVNSLYLARVTYEDWLFGQLMDSLKATDLMNRTTIIYSSDHGDFAGDYHLVEKWGGGLDDVLTHVPLIISTPGGARGHVVKEPVQSFDIMATILDLANISTNHTHFAQSLKSQLFGASGDGNRTIYAEDGFYYHNENPAFDPMDQDISHPTNMYYPDWLEYQDIYPDGAPRAVMARNVNYKIVYRPRGESELYDINNDPRELKNLYNDPSYTNIRNQMQTDLLYWFVQTGDIVPMEEDSRYLPPFPPVITYNSHLVVSGCASNLNLTQTFTWINNKISLQANQSMCVEAQGTELVFTFCGDNIQEQIFIYNGTQIVSNASGYCVEIAGNSPGQNAIVDLGPCSTTKKYQSWNFYKTGDFLSGTTGQPYRCLTGAPW